MTEERYYKMVDSFSRHFYSIPEELDHNFNDDPSELSITMKMLYILIISTAIYEFS
jgi:hypothetical protein